MDVGDLGSRGQPERTDNYRRNVLWLQKEFGSEVSPLSFEDGRLHWAVRSAKEDAQNSHAVGVNFLSQTVGDAAKGVLAGRILPHIGPGRKTSTRVDEDDLSPMRTKIRQQALC